MQYLKMTVVSNSELFYSLARVLPLSHPAQRRFSLAKNIKKILRKSQGRTLIRTKIKFGIRQLWNDPHERQCLEGVAGQESKSQLTSGSFKQATIIDLEILMRLAKSCYHTHL